MEAAPHLAGSTPAGSALAVLAPILVHVSIVMINHGLGAPLPTTEQLSRWPEIPVTFLVMLVLVGLGEEAGWTAFAAPVLLERHGLIGAWAILSAMRILAPAPDDRGSAARGPSASWGMPVSS